MTKINYKLADGKIIELEVTDEQAAAFAKINRSFNSNERKFRIRRSQEISLNFLSDKYSLDFKDDMADIEQAVERKDEAERLRQVINCLEASDKAIVCLYFYKAKTQTQIAMILNVTQSCIQKRLQAIYRKLKKFFKVFL